MSSIGKDLAWAIAELEDVEGTRVYFDGKWHSIALVPAKLIDEIVEVMQRVADEAEE